MEEYLIEHCSPTLASLKTSNLFRYAYGTPEELELRIRELNSILQPKGVRVIILHQCRRSALIYVFRPQRLQADLQKEGVREFLAAQGYESVSAADALERLRSRMVCGGQFPHEIGIFLGYPLHDVEGFIANAGKNCECCGCWKVYGNACEAVRLFARFEKCKKVYKRLFEQGKTLLQLTVAAA